MSVISVDNKGLRARHELDSAPSPGGEPFHRALAGALADLRFGSVEITVHDGRIVLIERREKVRIDTAPNPILPPA